MTTDNSARPASFPPIETAGLPFHTADELGDRWRALMGPLGFSERLVWVGFVDRARALRRPLVQLEVPGPPDPDLAEGLVHLLSEICDRHDVTGSAVLLMRPGVDGIAPWDRGWSRQLHGASERFGLPMEPMFRANAADVVEVPPSVTRRC
ncbi:hypothetical protein ASG12_10060 [Williamsia sp. Leaf354]|uniref:hypothetical protein n=1 Tax=Williamsia sp. Leaf354 TaxID=1736349 RepID=UPI0007003D7F|nr:hypothetical protein [Williamsia sp. Leaf354]KQR98722.1 hypothetical protein ASG12_10060 [Williamsia sp. Leaf354]